MRIDIRGTIIPNDDKFYFDYFDLESTCPADVSRAFFESSQDEPVQVYINSPGGEIASGSEIYSMIRSAAQTRDVKIYVVGEACSAASVIACAAYCEMAPTAMMMVHCVSTCACGNHGDMEHAAEVLAEADRAICAAYTAKTGMSEEDALALMEHETWLSAEQAKELGLIDGIMFEESEPLRMAAGPFGMLPTEAQKQRVRDLIEQERAETEQKLNLAKARYRLLTLKGGNHYDSRRVQNPA